MANNYYDATGVLVLDRVTPVITALFGGFKLDASYPGKGLAYIALVAEDNTPTWDDIRERLVDLAASLGLPLPIKIIPSMDKVLEVFARHFGADHDEELDNLIEHHAFEDAVDLDALFLIATRFDDGHNLREIRFEGCWHCSKPRLFEFGGDGYFLSREFETSSTSGQALQLGLEAHQALLGGDLDKAATVIAHEARRLLAGVTDDAQRMQMQQRVAALVQAGLH